MYRIIQNGNDIGKFQFDKDLERPDFPLVDMLREVTSISYVLPIVISSAHMWIVNRFSKLSAWHDHRL